MSSDISLSTSELSLRVDGLTHEVNQYGPRSVPVELRREHVLACARLLFTERGYEATSMVDVATEAGVTKPVIYGLFGSKEELFGATMSATMDELLLRTREAMSNEPDPTRYGYVASRAYFEFVQERRAAWTHLLRSPAGIVGEWIEKMHRRHADELRQTIVARLNDAGIRYSSSRVDAFSVVLVAAVTSLAGWWVEHPEISIDEISTFYADATGPGLRAVYL